MATLDAHNKKAVVQRCPRGDANLSIGRKVAKDDVHVGFHGNIQV